jgi:hypothetical protein
LKLGAAGDQLALDKRNGQLDEFVEVNRLGLVLALFANWAISTIRLWRSPTNRALDPTYKGLGWTIRL